MNVTADNSIGILAVVCWFAGIVLAHGFSSTFFAIFFPPYGWYLIVERAMAALGIA